MGTPLETLSIYEDMVLLSAQMVEAARSADWPLLSTLEVRCSSHIARLKRNVADASHSDDANTREHKVALIKKILDDDRTIRSLTEPWMKQLSNLMKNTNTERKLIQAYGIGL